MVLLYNSIDNAYLLYRGSMYVFDFRGEFVSIQELDSKVVGRASKVNVVSVVTSGNKNIVSIGVQINETFKSYDKQLQFNNVLLRVQSIGSLLFIGKRRGIHQGIPFIQSFFVFNTVVDLKKKLVEVGLYEDNSCKNKQARY